jgi:hypothetical protein
MPLKKLTDQWLRYTSVKETTKTEWYWLPSQRISRQVWNSRRARVTKLSARQIWLRKIPIQVVGW